MSVMAELSMFPMAPQSRGSLSPYVARVLTVIRQSGLTHQLGPMGTVIEGEWDAVMSCVSACFKELEKDCDRVYMTLKIDWKRGNDSRMTSKTQAVMDKL
ncbi:MTH1187 family thiamine-binding protein [Oleidesulfovibrio sp.]|uniref:MTH1187 family thiamine-binding protein n=1 Tax=Oleidesulfovibrio sp. TaxID=2909707 RepID=UPI003A8799D4